MEAVSPYYATIHQILSAEPPIRTPLQETQMPVITEKEKKNESGTFIYIFETQRNATECGKLHLQFSNFSGGGPAAPPTNRRPPPPTHRQQNAADAPGQPSSREMRSPQ